MALPIRDGLPTRRFPWITLVLMVINVVVFLFIQPSAFQNPPDADRENYYQEYQRQLDAEEFSARWGAVPCELLSGDSVASQPDQCTDISYGPGAEGKSVYLALLTAMFLHGGLLHLVSNMLFLWVFGNNVEDRLGRASYLGVYLIGGVLATFGYVAFNSHLGGPMIGASGAIAAVMGAYFVFHPRARILTMIATAAFQIVYVPAAVVLALFFVTQLFFTADEYVAWEAHVAGMVAGAIMALMIRLVPAFRRRNGTAQPAMPSSF
ncbi:MAG: rhomboid family intramembrane serine protease [Aquihabitans sp.]